MQHLSAKTGKSIHLTSDGFKYRFLTNILNKTTSYQTIISNPFKLKGFDTLIKNVIIKLQLIYTLRPKREEGLL